MLLKSRAVVFLGYILSTHVADICSLSIKSLDIPVIVRNGTGPVDLSCAYEIDEYENGLVVKWYRDFELIYQWIPPLPPRDVGVIAGLAEYPDENLKDPYSLSKIRLRTVTTNMTGDYTCSVSTFQEEATEKKRMTVYVPETSLNVNVTEFNRTHAIVTCVARGAQPIPTLTFYVHGQPANNSQDVTLQAESYRDDPWLMRQTVIEQSDSWPLIECEMSIPNTDYRRRERIVHFSTEYLEVASDAVGNSAGTIVASLAALVYVIA